MRESIEEKAVDGQIKRDFGAAGLGPIYSRRCQAAAPPPPPRPPRFQHCHKSTVYMILPYAMTVMVLLHFTVTIQEGCQVKTGFTQLCLPEQPIPSSSTRWENVFSCVLLITFHEPRCSDVHRQEHIQRICSNDFFFVNELLGETFRP